MKLDNELSLLSILARRSRRRPLERFDVATTNRLRIALSTTGSCARLLIAFHRERTVMLQMYERRLARACTPHNGDHEIV